MPTCIVFQTPTSLSSLLRKAEDETKAESVAQARLVLRGFRSVGLDTSGACCLKMAIPKPKIGHIRNSSDPQQFR